MTTAADWEPIQHTNTIPLLHTCPRCGTTFDWRAAKFLGYTQDDTWRIEQKNCTCDGTCAKVVAYKGEYPDDVT